MFRIETSTSTVSVWVQKKWRLPLVYGDCPSNKTLQILADCHIDTPAFASAFCDFASCNKCPEFSLNSLFRDVSKEGGYVFYADRFTVINKGQYLLLSFRLIFIIFWFSIEIYLTCIKWIMSLFCLFNKILSLRSWSEDCRNRAFCVMIEPIESDLMGEYCHIFFINRSR